MKNMKAIPFNKCTTAKKSASESSCIPGIYTIHRPRECNHKLDGRPIHLKNKTAYDGKTMLDIVQPDEVRRILVPSKTHNIYPAIWHKDEMNRLKAKAKVVSREEMLAMLAENDAKRNHEREQQQKRKDEMRKRQKGQISGPKLTEVECDARRRQMHLLRRAFEMKQEQEEDVKEVNQMIMATKVMAIRQAQIKEKERIARELLEEDARLDKMVEQDLQKAQIIEDEQNAFRRQHKEEFITTLNEQLKEIEMEKLLEAERIEEEGRANNRLMIAMQLDDIRKAEQKQADILRTQAELRRSNDELAKYRAMEAEEARIQELRLKTYMDHKLAKELEFEEEQNAIKEAKKKELLRQTEKLGNAQEAQALQDELNAQRIQEQHEREYRRKEQEKAEQRVATIRDMEESRKQMMDHLQRQQALQQARAEEDFKFMLDKIKKDDAKEEEKKRIQAAKMKDLRDSIVNQINTKEYHRREAKAQDLRDGIGQRMQDNQRNKHIMEMVDLKVKKLQESSIPQEYLDNLVVKIKNHTEKNMMK